jgi:hypothetical protein
MNWITDKIAIGDYREAQNDDLLRQAGFRAILDLHGTLRDKLPEE